MQHQSEILNLKSAICNLECYRETIFNASDVIDIWPFSVTTSPVTETVCATWGTSFAFFSAARAPLIV